MFLIYYLTILIPPIFSSEISNTILLYPVIKKFNGKVT